MGVLRKEIETGDLQKRAGIEKAISGLMDSIHVSILDPREKLPAEEPRWQPVHLPRPADAIEKTSRGGRDGSGSEG